MNDLQQKLDNLNERLIRAWAVVDIQKKQEKMDALEAEMSLPGFWADQEKARRIGSAASALKQEIQKWQKFKKEIEDLQEMLALDSADEAVNLREDFEVQIEKLEKMFSQMELELFLPGKYDTKSAIVTIHAGTGGTDAQDWAEMLLRMYLRLAEKQGWKTEIISISSGQEAGIKSVQFDVE